MSSFGVEGEKVKAYTTLVIPETKDVLRAAAREGNLKDSSSQ